MSDVFVFLMLWYSLVGFVFSSRLKGWLTSESQNSTLNPKP